MAACATIHPSGTFPGKIEQRWFPQAWRPGGTTRSGGPSPAPPAPLAARTRAARTARPEGRKWGFWASWRPKSDSSRQTPLARRSIVDISGEKAFGAARWAARRSFSPEIPQSLYQAKGACSGRQRGTARAKARTAPTTSSCSPGAFRAHYSDPLRGGPLHEVNRYSAGAPGPASPAAVSGRPPRSLSGSVSFS